VFVPPPSREASTPHPVKPSIERRLTLDVKQYIEYTSLVHNSTFVFANKQSVESQADISNDVKYRQRVTVDFPGSRYDIPNKRRIFADGFEYSDATSSIRSPVVIVEFHRRNLSAPVVR
jgi:hypothetical protein